MVHTKINLSTLGREIDLGSGFVDLETILPTVGKTLSNGVNSDVSIATQTVVNITGPTADFTIGGIAGGREGRFLCLLNRSGQELTIAHQLGSSTAANRIICPGAVTVKVPDDQGAWLVYNATESRWYVIKPEFIERCLAKHDANQTISDSTPTYLALNSEEFDTDGMHDNSTDNSRVTITKTGVYVVGFNVGFDSNASGGRAVFLYKNRTDILIAITFDAVATSGFGTALIGAGIFALAPGDYVEVQVYQTSGGDLDVFSGCTLYVFRVP